MRKIPIVAAITAALMVASGCTATLQRAFQYPSGQRDASAFVGDRQFFVTFHRSDSTVLVTRSLAGVFGQWNPEPMPYWRAAAQAVVREIGCDVTEVYSLGGDGGGTIWEARYACPEGTPVIALVEQRAPAWREQGVHTDDPLGRR